MLEAYKQRHEMVYGRLKEMKKVKVIPADGTFYTFPNVQAAIDDMPNVNDDVAFAEHLLSEVGIALVPGSAFGSPGCIRLSFATSMEVLDDALNRIARVID